jgi:hypothetical protein
MALIVKSRKLSLLVSYLETYLGKLVELLRDWRISVNVLKSTAVSLAETAKRIEISRPVFSENKYSGSKQHGMLWWPLIQS